MNITISSSPTKENEITEERAICLVAAKLCNAHLSCRDVFINEGDRISFTSTTDNNVFLVLALFFLLARDLVYVRADTGCICIFLGGSWTQVWETIKNMDFSQISVDVK